MITYSKKYWSLPLLLRTQGSAIPNVIPFGLLSAGLCVLWNFIEESYDTDYFVHPYPFQIFAFIVGFLLVFRANHGYVRYNEGRTNLQLMTSKWSDLAAQSLAFDSANLRKPGKHAELLEDCQDFGERVVHVLSLMHACGLQYLRNDKLLSNLKPFEELYSAAFAEARPPANTCDGEWVSRSVRRRFVYDKFSPDLMEITHAFSNAHLGVLGPLTSKEEEKLLHTPERVMACLVWTHDALVRRREQGGLDETPPVVSRMYQVLADGHDAYMQARKLTDTPFPFPYAQLVTFLLAIFAIIAPIVFADKVKNVYLACVLTFITVVSYYGLNEVCKELEDPFLWYPNELPAPRLQHEFNVRLLVALEHYAELTYGLGRNGSGHGNKV